MAVKNTVPTLKGAIFIVYVMWQVSGCQLQEGLLVPVSTSADGCVCPGDVVTYECTVFGGGVAGNTIWRGSGFNCPQSNNEMILRHSHYNSSAEVYLSCNHRRISGSIVRVENDSISLNYTSQLNVMLTSDLVNTTIECVHDNGSSEIVVGSTVITEELCTFPSNISWIYICSQSNLVIDWSMSVSNCSTEQYLINTSNCGSCPTITINDSIICTNAPTDGNVCMITIQSEVQGTILSDLQQFISPLLECPVANELGDGRTTTVIVSTVIVLLVAILLIVLITLCLLKAGISSSNPQIRNMLQMITSNGEDSEVANAYYCNEIATVKVFDNASNGMYGLEDIVYTDNNSSEIRRSSLGTINETEILDLDTLLTKLQDQVSSCWYELGEALGVSEDILKQLLDYCDKDALIELLDYWLKNHSGKPTWQEIADALKKIPSL